jgi:hypothetical protein
MTTIRNIKIATGIKRIELSNENFAMPQIQDVLKQHREALINSLVSDLTTYVKYKFSNPATKEQLQRIKDKLFDLKNSSISLSIYSEIIGEVLANESTYVKSEPFYHEINSVIGEELNPSQLVLVK